MVLTYGDRCLATRVLGAFSSLLLQMAEVTVGSRQPPPLAKEAKRVGKAAKAQAKAAQAAEAAEARAVVSGGGFYSALVEWVAATAKTVEVKAAEARAKWVQEAAEAKAKADAAEVEQIRLQERVPDEVEEHV